MMPDIKQDIPLQTLHLFPILDRELISLLRSLTAAEWQLPTIAKLWTVKDIAAHLLDGNLRTISFLRDNYFVEAIPVITSYSDLIACLNQLNMSWTNAAKSLSPKVLIEFLTTTGNEYIEQLQKLDPFADAIFPVAWAGEERSANWFHIAREYTEKFIHQQQVRDDVGKPGILTKELFHPFINTFMYALTYTYSDTDAAAGTVVQVKILTDIGGIWNLEKQDNNWALKKNITSTPSAIITISPDIAWKLFSKGISP